MNKRTCYKTFIMDVIRCVLFVVSVFGVNIRSEQTAGEEDKNGLCTGETSPLSCIQPNKTAICSGRGNCICGMCQCFTLRGDLPLTYYGKWCECDDSSCPFFNGAICGGSDHGTCECGLCRCLRDFTGKDCGCPVSTDHCTSKDGRICGGRGTCECNGCRCNEGSFGPHCTQTQSIGLCDLNKDCVFCKTGYRGDNTEQCNKACQHLKVSFVDQIQETQNIDKEIYCVYKDLEFVVETDENNHLQIKVAKQKGSRNDVKVISSISVLFLLPCVVFVNHLLN